MSKKHTLDGLIAILGLTALVVGAFFGCTNPIRSTDPDSGADLVPPGVRSDQGRLDLYLKDFPLGDQTVTNLWITLGSVEVHGESSGWFTVFENLDSATYDLLTLVEEPVYLGTADLPADTYTQVRLMLGTDNSIVLAEDGEPRSLEVPSGQKTGIKIVGDFEVREGFETSVTLDFDAQESVNVTGNGRYQLRPTVRIEAVDYRPVDRDNRQPAVTFPEDY
jgi:hypothetical protein